MASESGFLKVWQNRNKYEIRNTAVGNQRNLGADSNYIFIIVS